MLSSIRVSMYGTESGIYDMGLCLRKNRKQFPYKNKCFLSFLTFYRRLYFYFSLHFFCFAQKEIHSKCILVKIVNPPPKKGVRMMLQWWNLKCNAIWFVSRWHVLMYMYVYANFDACKLKPSRLHLKDNRTGVLEWNVVF